MRSPKRCSRWPIAACRSSVAWASPATCRSRASSASCASSASTTALPKCTCGRSPTASNAAAKPKSGRADAEPLHHFLQSEARNTEQLGGARLIAFRELERTLDQLALELVDLSAQVEI